MLRALISLMGRVASPGNLSGKLAILTYHRVPLRHDPLLHADQIDAACFDAQMAFIAKSFHVLPLDEAVSRLHDRTLPPRAVSITFDDGYDDNHTVALPILQKHGLTATFFICSGYLGSGLMFNDIMTEAVRRAESPQADLSWLGLGLRGIESDTRRQLANDLTSQVKYLPADERQEVCLRVWQSLCPSSAMPRVMMTPEQVLDLARQGMIIGGHTHTHPILKQSSLEEARRDIQLNIESLRSITGATPKLFAYPNGRPDLDFTAEHMALVRELGFEAAVSTRWGTASRHADPFALPRLAPWPQSGANLAFQIIRSAFTTAS